MTYDVASLLNLSPEMLPGLQPNHALVWWIDRRQLPLPSEVAQNLLSAEEQQRGDRFKFPVDRDRYRTSRAILRLLLSHYLSCPPDQIPFQYSSTGKPGLPSPYDQMGLQFNLSHAGTISLYGLTVGNRIGVDLEPQRTIPHLDDIVKTQFSPQIAAQFCQVSPQNAPVYFFRLWTVTEAYLKATGQGLAGLAAVNLWENAIAPFESLTPVPGLPQPWSTLLFEMPESTVGAIAIEGKAIKVAIYSNCHSLSDNDSRATI
ncbi:MAG TPA: 4'-phosphopantetheinyl transferase superfamily protein [Candidatus Obscuribacterales bacterium]